MAIITTSPIVSEIRGSVGTQTFSKNHYRPYVKVRKAPTQSSSIYASDARSFMADIVSQWQSETAASQAAWNAVADLYNAHERLGKKSRLSGYNAFVRAWINQKYVLIGSGPLPVVSGSVPRLLSLSSNFDHAALSLSFTIDNNNSRFRWVFKISKPVSTGVTSNNSVAFYYVKGGAFTGTSNSPSVATAATTRIPSLATAGGKKLFIQLYFVDTKNGVAFPANYLSGILV